MKNYLFEQNVNHCGDIVFDKSIAGGVKGCAPGEWVALENKKDKTKFWAFINPFRQDGKVARLVDNFENYPNPELYIAAKIKSALLFREKYIKESGSRLFFGSSDGIPGLVIDRFENVVVIQYHLLGAMFFRNLIVSLLKSNYPEIKVCESTKPEAGEEMVLIETDFPPIIQVLEQGIIYEISSDKFQKTGFYYDHRNNRKRLFDFFTQRDLKPEKVIDLYSYLGSWGAPFHRYLGSQVSFIDQANLEGQYQGLFERYGNNQGSNFTRSNVSSFLDEQKEFEYDLVICDPPAFKKGQDKKKEALLGYDTLMKKIIPKMKKESFLAFSSCTHGVTHFDLDQCVQKAAQKNQKKMQLMDIGLQDIDHPMTGLSDKSMYIKYLLYICKE